MSKIACNLRTLLRDEPILIHTKNGLKKLGGAGQCSQRVLRSVLARLHNWTVLAKQIVKAEVPWFEAFNSLSTLLQLNGSPTADEYARATCSIATLLSLSPDTVRHYFSQGV